jgi:hypothetical protein
MVVSGKVIDEDNSGIPAAVYLSDQSGTLIQPSVGVSADISGNFKLNVPSGREGNYITATFVGTTKQTKKLASVSNFKLVTDAELPEVTVTVNKIKKPNIGKIIGFTLLASAIIYGIYKYNTVRG